MYQPLSDRAGPPDVYVRRAPPPPPTQPLDGWRHVDVAVIGGGFTGLSTALHLAEAGIDVAVLEAKEIGWGASGRAFGQVVPYLKLGEPAILRHYGTERGTRIIDAVAAGPDLVFELIFRHRIECWATRSGLIFAAHSPGGRRDLERRTAVLAAARRAGGDAGRHALRRGDRFAAVSGGVARSARRQHQSVRLCARAGACRGEGGSDPAHASRACAG